MAKNNSSSPSRKSAVTSKQLKALLAKCAADRDDREALAAFLKALADRPLYVPCVMHITEEAAALMKKLDEEGVTSENISEEDRRAISDGLRPIPMDVTIDGVRLVPVYTDKKEVVILPEDHELIDLGLGYVYGYVKDTDGVAGVVFNRETDCFELYVRKDEEPEDASDGSPDAPVIPGGKPSHIDVSDSGLGIGVDRMDVFNYALYTNGILPVRGIRILNRTGEPARGLTLRISSSYAFFDTFEQALPDIPEGRPVPLPDPALVVRGGVLAGLTESVNASVTVELVSGGERMCAVTEQMLVLAYDQWMGGKGYAELLPAFVMPNHPVIPILRNDVRNVLASWNKSVSAEGYQRNDPNRVRELAAAAYGAVQAKNIGYSEAPAGFTVQGQRIRTPETVLDQRTGTCMDMTLLYAALLEDMGLHPLLVLVKGHIFAGIWLRKRTPEELYSAPVVIDDLNYLTARTGTGSDELTFVECTAMCAGKNVTFEQAEQGAGAELWGLEFDCAIDVFLARARGVKSLPARTKSGYKIAAAEADLSKITPPPAELDITLAEPAAADPRRITNKKDLWESKLLDLSSRNMLLNLPFNASVE
ncbi:MAG: SseB family protein, partial [Abditibacteriota bacterium]|nr:SseB family protein [Abditibacteriota bacterium]